MRALKDEQRVWTALNQFYRKLASLYPRVALLSFALALSTSTTHWTLGEMLIDDGRVGVLFTVAMGAITASLSRDIYALLLGIRLPERVR